MAAADSKPKERYTEITVLNIFFCILVVFIHISVSPLKELRKESWEYLFAFIPRQASAFVVQGYIFLSGLKMFLSRSDSFSYGKFLLKRFLNVFLPYILWCFIYYYYFTHNRFWFPFRWEDFVRYVYVGDLVSPFYFIIVIAQYYLLAPFWRRFIKKTNPVILAAFAAIISIVSIKYLPDIIAMFVPGFEFLYADRVFTSYMIYWVAGCFAGLYYEDFKKALRENRHLVIPLFSILLVIYVSLYYRWNTAGRMFPFLEDLRIMYCLSAILFYYSMSVVFVSRKRRRARPSSAEAATPMTARKPIDETVLQEELSKTTVSESKEQKIVGSEAAAAAAIVRFGRALMVKMRGVAWGKAFLHTLDRSTFSVYLGHCFVMSEFDFILKKNEVVLRIGQSYMLRILVIYVVSFGGSMIWRKLRDGAEWLVHYLRLRRSARKESAQA